VSVAAGALVLLLTVLSAVVHPARACGGLSDRYPPIIAFELARDGRDLTALFGGPGACRDRLIAAMDLANVIDLAAFLPAYALFLAAWFRCRRGGAPAAARWGVAIVVGAALADVLENVGHRRQVARAGRGRRGGRDDLRARRALEPGGRGAVRAGAGGHRPGDARARALRPGGVARRGRGLARVPDRRGPPRARHGSGSVARSAVASASAASSVAGAVPAARRVRCHAS
jgi:hypothetical protein